MVKKISEKEFDEVKCADIAVIDFSATWCGPCKMLAPVLEGVSEDMKDHVKFYNIDVDENPNLAEEFGITSIPALVIVKHGEKKDLQIGFQPKEDIVRFVNSQL